MKFLDCGGGGQDGTKGREWREGKTDGEEPLTLIYVHRQLGRAFMEASFLDILAKNHIELFPLIARFQPSQDYVKEKIR